MDRKVREKLLPFCSTGWITFIIYQLGNQIKNIDKQDIGDVFLHKLYPNGVLYDCNTQVSRKKLLNLNNSWWTKVSELHYQY